MMLVSLLFHSSMQERTADVQFSRLSPCRVGMPHCATRPIACHRWRRGPGTSMYLSCRPDGLEPFDALEQPASGSRDDTGFTFRGRRSEHWVESFDSALGIPFGSLRSYQTRSFAVRDRGPPNRRSVTAALGCCRALLPLLGGRAPAQNAADWASQAGSRQSMVR